MNRAEANASLRKLTNRFVIIGHYVNSHRAVDILDKEAKKVLHITTNYLRMCIHNGASVDKFYKDNIAKREQVENINCDSNNKSVLNTDLHISHMVSDDFYFPTIRVDGKHYLKFHNVFNYVGCGIQSLFHGVDKTKANGFIKFTHNDLPFKDRKMLMSSKNSREILMINVKRLYYGLKELLNRDYHYDEGRVRKLIGELIDQYRDEIEDLSPQQLQMELDAHNDRVNKLSYAKPVQNPLKPHELIKAEHAKNVYKKKHAKAISDLKSMKRMYESVHKSNLSFHDENMELKDKINTLHGRIGGLTGAYNKYQNIIRGYEKRIAELEKKRKPWYMRVLSAAFN